MSQNDAFRNELQMRAQTVRQREDEERIAAAAHDACTKALREAVSLYNNMRRALIMSKILSRKISWCTGCKKAVLEADLALVLHEGTAGHSGGYQGGDYYFEDFMYLHSACGVCRERLFKMHGWTGHVDSYTRKQAKTLTFNVEQREDGFYANQFGNWHKVVPKNNWEKPLSLPVEMPDNLIEELATEWKLPHALGLKCNSQGAHSVVIVPRTISKDPNAILF
jgi:hypothetical protein